jgi:phosphatidylinositol alpha-1,6-mannosyltransferase
MAELRALFVTTSYPSSPVDRAGPFVHMLARGLVRSGVRVTVLAPAYGEARGRSCMDGVEVHRFRFLPDRWQTLAMGFGGVPAALRSAPWRLVQLPLMIASAAASALRAAGDHDVLHAHWLPNLLPLAPAAWLRRRPRLVTLWGSDVEWYERSPRLQPVFRRLLRGADGIAAINEHMCRLFDGARRPGAELRLIPSGVDTDLFHPRDRGELRRRLGVEEGEFAIVFAASLIPRKGADVAIEALAQMRAAATLLLIGEGPERQRLESLAAERGVADRVRFLGERSLAEVALHMAAADTFVLPSHYEGRPNVVLEAQASGLAVVASDIPGCRDLIQPGETGLLVPAGDAAALATAFDALAEDRALCRRLGDNALAAIRDGGLTWEACASHYARFYTDLTGPRAASTFRASHAGAPRS